QNAAADQLNTIEIVRAQLQALHPQLASERRNADLLVRGDSLEQHLIAVEVHLQDLRQTGRGQDGVRWPTRLGGQLSYLAGNIAASDFAPTTQQGAVHAQLQKQVQDNRAVLDKLLQTELTAFNRMLSGKGLKPITTEAPRLMP